METTKIEEQQFTYTFGDKKLASKKIALYQCLEKDLIAIKKYDKILY